MQGNDWGKILMRDKKLDIGVHFMSYTRGEKERRIMEKSGSFEKIS